MQLEPKDQRLLALLRDNARMSVIDMAKTLGVSRGTVQNRMRRLENQGVITGYTCLLYTSPSPRDLSTSRMPSSA